MINVRVQQYQGTYRSFHQLFRIHRPTWTSLEEPMVLSSDSAKRVPLKASFDKTELNFVEGDWIQGTRECIMQT